MERPTDELLIGQIGNQDGVGLPFASPLASALIAIFEARDYARRTVVLTCPPLSCLSHKRWLLRRDSRGSWTRTSSKALDIPGGTRS